MLVEYVSEVNGLPREAVKITQIETPPNRPLASRLGDLNTYVSMAQGLHGTFRLAEEHDSLFFVMDTSRRSSDLAAVHGALASVFGYQPLQLKYELLQVVGVR